MAFAKKEISMTDTPKPPEYKVGYGKPPLHSRFKKGERRNSRGRPKAKKTITEIFKKVIAEKVTVANGDTSERITKGQAVFRANFQEALKSGRRAMDNLFQLMNEVGVLNEVPTTQRAYFAIPERVSEEEFERRVEEANRMGAERARHEAELRRRNVSKSQE
jgi:Family of unknown function (DUF5681)